LNTLKALTQSAKDSLEPQYGSRFTLLMNLKYYDYIKFAIIDLMHNLYFGTAKRIMQKEWLDMLANNDLSMIQERVENCTYTGTIGRIPRKITSPISSLTADEWKNWTLIFSLISLFDIRTSIRTFVMLEVLCSACKIYSSPIVIEIDQAHDSMHRCFMTAEQLYGPDF